MRSLRLLAAGGLAFGCLLVTAGQASADPVDSAVATLRSSSVYVGASRPKIDPAKLQDALSGIKVAIVPTGGPSPVAVAERIGGRLDPGGDPLTVLVFEGTSYGAASTAYCGVGSVIERVVGQHRGQLQSTDDVTSTVADFAAAVSRQPSAASGCAGSEPASSFGDQAKGSGHTGLIVLLVILALVIGVIALIVRSRRRRHDRDLEDARAQVMPYYQQLEHELATVQPGLNKTAGQALSDARARLASAGQQLAAAATPEQLAQARRTTLEGLYAVRTARAALGLDPGPPLPSLTGGSADHLSEPQEVSVQGRSYAGYPTYMPSAPYYFGGGWGIPGGWYGAPFWEGMLLGGVLTGGFGGFGWGGGWGGYGAGYDNGYLTGYEAGEQSDQSPDAAAQDGGAGWDGQWGDSGGGGDWGPGDAGGGDWGGGGGDWSGGDVGGGVGGGGDWGGGNDGGGGNW